MKKRSLLLPFLLLAGAACAAATPIDDWQVYETAVRDGKIGKQEAALRLGPLVGNASSYVLANYTLEQGTWAFPLKGYGPSAADRNSFHPKGYYGPYGIKGYDFFDGNRHGGHPALDIFIRDRDQDALDDRTGQPVEAIAMTDAVVLSINAGWEKGDPVRGGNYVWLYAPQENRFLYYAHLKDISVKPGDIVRRGEAVGTVGRSGQLASMKRSPTHVHLMVLEYREGKLVPYNYYSQIAHPRKQRRKE